jgi:D-alanyl-D-alanine carboxypeptidase
MKNYTSDAQIQPRIQIPPLPPRSKLSKYTDKPSTPQHSTKLPFISSFSDEPTKIRKILYYKPEVSAKSWIAIDCSSGVQIDGNNSEEQREIASLTKILTCVVCIQEVFRLKKNFDEFVEVSLNASSMDGTTAGLAKGESLKIWDLLHALMLPSGNDAAVALAEYFGGFINPSAPVVAFLARMNAVCRQLKIIDSVFRNPHGMSTSINLSSARSVAIIAVYAMKIPIFAKIVSTYSYSCNVYTKDGSRKVTWINTNRLLRKGFCGVKTGYTPAAGPCLCSYIEQRNKKLMIVMLSSKSMQSRWAEASKLWKWANAHVLN